MLRKSNNVYKNNHPQSKMSKITKVLKLPQSTYDHLYAALLPKYEKLIQFIAHKYYDSSYISDGLDDRLSNGYISLFQAIRAYCTYKIENAQDEPVEVLESILLEKADKYIKTVLWNLRACEAKRGAIRHELGGAMFSLQGINNDTGILNTDLMNTVVDRSLMKL